MKFNDLTKLLEQDESIFQPRKMEDRKTRYIQQIQKQIQDYINNGSKGNLNLFRTPIQTLPAGLKVGGDLNLILTPIQTLPGGLKVGGTLWLSYTPIAKQYDRQQLKQMYPGVKGHINI